MSSTVHLFSSFPFYGGCFDFLKNFVLSSTHLTAQFLSACPASFAATTGIYTEDIPHTTKTDSDLLQTGIMTENTQFPLQAVSLPHRQLPRNSSLGTHRGLVKNHPCILSLINILLTSNYFPKIILNWFLELLPINSEPADTRNLHDKFVLLIIRYTEQRESKIPEWPPT